MNRNEEALPVLRTALATATRKTATDGQSTEQPSPFLVQIYQELAFCYGALHQVEQAMEMLDMTETLDCDHVDILIIRGHILLQNNKIEQAEKAFKTAILMNDMLSSRPDQGASNAPSVILRIIVSLYDNQYIYACYQLLLKFFQMVKEYYPDYKSGNAYMALCCYDMGRSKEFMKYLRLAIDSDPHEAKTVLSCLFPEGTPVSQYIPYMEERIKN